MCWHKSDEIMLSVKWCLCHGILSGLFSPTLISNLRQDLRNLRLIARIRFDCNYSNNIFQSFARHTLKANQLYLLDY